VHVVGFDIPATQNIGVGLQLQLILVQIEAYLPFSGGSADRWLE